MSVPIFRLASHCDEVTHMSPLKGFDAWRFVHRLGMVLFLASFLVALVANTHLVRHGGVDFGSVQYALAALGFAVGFLLMGRRTPRLMILCAIVLALLSLPYSPLFADAAFWSQAAGEVTGLGFLCWASSFLGALLLGAAVAKRASCMWRT